MTAKSLADIIGVNTHIDFNWTAYGNVQRVIDCLNYLGIKHVRDSANIAANVSAGLWKKVADATGVKFNAYIGSGSPQVMSDGLKLIPLLAKQNILESMEGGNEEDDTYAIANGNSIAKTALFQQQVFALGKQLGLPVINMSFGSGWAVDPLHGDYNKAGNLTIYCDYANAHTYPELGDIISAVNQENANAQLAAKKPVITTEVGFYTGTMTGGVTESQQSDKLMAAIAQAAKTNAMIYVYELLDQKTGDTNPENNFGLFRSDGTPKPTATALRNLLAKAAPPSAPASPHIAVNQGIINITDTYAAANPGKMTVNLTLSGSLVEMNTALAGCKGLVSKLDVWNQAGLNTVLTIPATN